MTCFARVASPYSLRNNLLVTLSHNLLLSVGSCFDSGLTILGTERNGVRSISVVHSSESLFLDALLFFAVPNAATAEDDDVDEDVDDEDDEPPPSEVAAARVEPEAGRQRTTLRQHPSKYTSARAGGTCLTLVHSSCSCEDGLYRCMTPSTKKCDLPSQL
jgi:hypothetical protein